MGETRSTAERATAFVNMVRSAKDVTVRATELGVKGRYFAIDPTISMGFTLPQQPVMVVCHPDDESLCNEMVAAIREPRDEYVESIMRTVMRAMGGDTARTEPPAVHADVADLSEISTDAVPMSGKLLQRPPDATESPLTSTDTPEGNRAARSHRRTAAMGRCRHGNDRDMCLDEDCWLAARRHATAMDEMRADIAATLDVTDEQAAWVIDRVRAYFMGRPPFVPKPGHTRMGCAGKANERPDVDNQT